MDRYRPDETWHRLREWTYGQTVSERMSAQILAAEGYTGIDPSEPLGGPDGGKDALCLRAGATYAMAAYFPRGQKPFSEIKAKFLEDLAKARRLGVQGLSFVTNQEIKTYKRNELVRHDSGFNVELFHLERITHILDRPNSADIRRKFLYIDETRPVHDQLSSMEARIISLVTGGDTFAYWMLYNYDLSGNFARDFVIIKEGNNTLYDLRIRIRDLTVNRDVFNNRWGEISAPAEFVLLKWPLSPTAYYRAFFHARNGQWHQDLMLKRSERDGCWLHATRVKGTDGRTIRLEKSDTGFVEQFGEPNWSS